MGKGAPPPCDPATEGRRRGRVFWGNETCPADCVGGFEEHLDHGVQVTHGRHELLRGRATEADEGTGHADLVGREKVKLG